MTDTIIKDGHHYQNVELRLVPSLVRLVVLTTPPYSQSTRLHPPSSLPLTAQSLSPFAPEPKLHQPRGHPHSKDPPSRPAEASAGW